MARSTANIVSTVVIVVLLLLGLAAAVLGPRLYREGKAFVAPIAELAGSEGAVAALDSPAMPEATGIPLENQELLWRHRARIAAIGDLSANPLHGMFREGSGAVVTVDEAGRPVLGQPAESNEQE